jgi:hypothetical protein
VWIHIDEWIFIIGIVFILVFINFFSVVVLDGSNEMGDILRGSFVVIQIISD